MTFDPLAAVILIARTLYPGVPAFRHHSVLGNLLKSRDSLEEARVSREFPEFRRKMIALNITSLSTTISADDGGLSWKREHGGA